jgi:hypothetical protein
MTDTDTTTTEEPTEAQPTDVPEPTDESTDPGEAKAGREAAKYRRQLRETEAQRDTLQTRVESAQLALVDHLAVTVGRIRPAALWASGAELANLLDADGNVDTQAVVKACEEAVSTLSLSRTPRSDPSGGQGAAPSLSGGGALADAFRPR